MKNPYSYTENEMGEAYCKKKVFLHNVFLKAKSTFCLFILKHFNLLKTPNINDFIALHKELNTKQKTFKYHKK